MCVPKLSRNCRENVLVSEKQWAHGCGHIGFPKSCYDGKHANVSDVRVSGGRNMTRAKLRTARTDHR